MSADHIPFVFNEGDCKILSSFYYNSFMIRVSLETRDKITSKLPSVAKLWLDGAVDGIDKWDPEREKRKKEKDEPTRTRQYHEHISQFAKCTTVRSPAFQTSPDRAVVKEFVRSVMDKCCEGSRKPDWLSIPQLPIVKGAFRNKINRLLAQAAGEWKAEKRFPGKMILPVVLTHQDLVNNKTQRKGPLSQVDSCFKQAGADGVWVAESSLNDQDGSGPLEKRFAGLIQFHQELNEFLPADAITVAGPYWGMNLVLWARGLVRYPAVSMGTGYRYNTPGVSFPTGKGHAAIPPLRKVGSR